MNNESYRTFFAAIMPRVWNFKLTINDVIEDSEANKVVVFATSKADSKAGVGSYGQQYVLSFWFDETETKIKRMVEFVDSAKAKEQRAILFG
jgi:ketosteroid isomerase-like protein